MAKVREEYAREDIERLKYWNRPTVRVRYGTGEADARAFAAEVWPDGNNVWVVFRPEGEGTPCVETKVSWGLLLEVLNDPQATPIWVWKRG